MAQSESIVKLTEALCKAMLEYKSLNKNKVNPYFNSRYADLSDCIECTRDALCNNGLAVIQTTNQSEIAPHICLITKLSHISGEWIDSRWPVNPIKQSPQDFGSALTYARRYSYQTITGISAEDDDDGNEASEPDNKKNVTPKKDNKSQPSVGSKPKAEKTTVDSKPSMVPDQAKADQYAAAERIRVAALNAMRELKWDDNLITKGWNDIKNIVSNSNLYEGSTVSEKMLNFEKTITEAIKTDVEKFIADLPF